MTTTSATPKSPTAPAQAPAPAPSTPPSTDPNKNPTDTPPPKAPENPATRKDTVVVGEHKSGTDHDYCGKPDKEDYDYDHDGKLSGDEVKDYEKDMKDFKTDLQKERDLQKEKYEDWKKWHEQQQQQQNQKGQGSIFGKAIPGTKI